MNNYLDSRLFDDKVDFNVFKKLLETFDHVEPKFESRLLNKLRGKSFLVKNGKKDKYGDFYNLYIPKDIKKGELLFYIDFLNKEFDIEKYSNTEDIIQRTKIMVGIICRNMGDNSVSYLDKLAKDYKLNQDFIERIKNIPIKSSENNKTFIKNIKDGDKKKLGKNEDVEKGSEILGNYLSKEFDLTFFRKGINMIRSGMETITKTEKDNLNQEIKDGKKVTINRKK